MAWSGRNYRGASKHRKALKHEEAQARIAASKQIVADFLHGTAGRITSKVRKSTLVAVTA